MEIGVTRRALDPAAGASSSSESNDSPAEVEVITPAQAFVMGALQHAMVLGGELRRQSQRSVDLARSMPTEQRVYDIVIPAYNEPEILKKCLDSLLAHTDPRHTIHVVNDASPDPGVDELLRTYVRRWPKLRYYRLPFNLGFPGAVNAALTATSHDVVLVNADTEFPPHWLGRLDRCLRSDPRIGAISPLSNNATICSVPRVNEKNALPAGLTVEAMDRLVADTSMRRYPRAPTVVGFCMLMTRKAIDEVGPLDMSFGRGYGEEVDWCQRAWAKGFESVICDDLFVFHHGEVGFSHVPEKRSLQEGNERILAQRWPRYHATVLTHATMNPLRCQQQRLFDWLRRGPPDRTRALHVLQRFDSWAGTELFVRRLVDGTKDTVQSTVLCPDQQSPWRDAVVEEDADGLLRVKMSMGLFPIEHVCRGVVLSLRSPNVERFFGDVVVGTGATVVHFSHLANMGSLALPLVARAVGAKIVIVLHDYFLLCPDWNLMDAAGRACPKARAENCPQCIDCLKSRTASRQGAPPLHLGEFLRDRAALARLVLELADVVIAPSQCVQEHFRRAFGKAIADRIRIVPHGTPEMPHRSPHRPDPRLRVAFIGNGTVEKGRDVFLEAARRLAGTPVHFRVIGELLPKNAVTPPEGMQIDGAYDPASLAERLQDVDVAFIGSLWDEAYCYTLDEAYRAGTPVIASRAGALAERVVEGQTGLLIAPGDPGALVEALRRLDSDRALLAAMRQQIAMLPLKTCAENLAEYERLIQALASSDVKSELIRSAMRMNARIPVPLPVGLGDVLCANGQALSLPLQPEPSTAAGAPAGRHLARARRRGH